MELAFHIRTPEDQIRTDQFRGEMERLYDCPDKTDWASDFPSADRIYIGDEFCPKRLPSLNKLERFCAMARERSLKITLLTPVLTDQELERYSFLFDYLETWEGDGTEIVVNDWGTLLFLKTHKAKLCTPDGLKLCTPNGLKLCTPDGLDGVSLGRLLNKGFKDPRLRDAENLTLFSSETMGLLNQSTFDHPQFQRLVKEMGISRLERDLLPYGTPVCQSGESEMKTSFYFPFGYVTTGRVCWTASFRQDHTKKFIPGGPCARLCNTLRFELTHPSLSSRVFQNGNTIFYLYPFSVLTAFLKSAIKENIRLVYQGGAI